MTDSAAYDRLLGRSRTRDAIAEREARRKAVHDALRAEIKADKTINSATRKRLLAIVERMHAEADERRAA